MRPARSSGIDTRSQLADLLSQARDSGPLRMRTATVTEVGGDGRLRTDLTGSAWLTRNLDGTFAPSDVVVVMVSGPLAVVVCRVG